jgi:hypothetical protein
MYAWVSYAVHNLHDHLGQVVNKIVSNRSLTEIRKDLLEEVMFSLCLLKGCRFISPRIMEEGAQLEEAGCS